MLKNIIDSHAHYNDKRFNDDRDELITNLKQNGVINVINAATDILDSQICIDYAKKYDGFYASIGIHPHEAADVEPDYIERLRALSKQEKVVAIGEIGLDYHYEFSPKVVQKRVFERLLKLAQEVNLPVIIHTREATADTLELLEKYPNRGVVHCFTGSAQTAKRLVDMGYYIGFTGVVTFANAKKPVEAVGAVPIERLLLETDCPYMAPTPFRGKRCDSTMIQNTAEFIAKIKGVEPQFLVDMATQNTKDIFGIQDVL